jgi:hypothetical protein
MFPFRYKEKYPKENNMLYSIITVCFNNPEELRKTLTSIDNQNYFNKDVIDINGGDKANIAAVVESFQSFALLPSYYLSYYNKNSLRLYSLSIAAVIAVILNITLIPLFGVTGAAISFVSAMFLYSLLISISVYLSLKKKTNIGKQV